MAWDETDESRLQTLAQRHGWSVEAVRELRTWIRDLLDETRDSADRETVLGATRIPSEDRVAPEMPTDRFELRAALGSGGMGEVWRVWDRSLRRSMAMKTVRADRRDAASLLARFVAEAQVTSQLRHPAIVPVHELGTLPDGRLFFTMREVRGFTLSWVVSQLHKASVDTWSQTADGWDLAWIIERFAQTCDAVGYAHERGVVHRDLKPTNIMIGEFGEVQVIDWGVAKVVGEGADEPVDTQLTDDPEQTAHGDVIGTPAYIPPEQAYGTSERVDPRADVYALGAILYEVLSNRPPFEAIPGQPVLSQVLDGPPISVGRTGGPTAPEGLATVCERAMSRDRGGRFANGTELAQAVRTWLTDRASP